MTLEFGTLSFNLPIWIPLLAGLVSAFGVTALVIPSVIQVSNEKRLFDKPDQRKSHTHEIPTLGGVAVFIGLMVATIFFSGPEGPELKFIFAGLLVLLYIGIKDDIMDISARRKLFVELLAIAIVVILGDIRVTNFHTFLGIRELPYIASLLFTFFMYVVIINGFNLIDGIDGLSAGVGVVSVVSLGLWFWLIGDGVYAVFCFSTAGALAAFFLFNVFGKKNKIFLGDTGALITGMLVSLFTVRFFEGSLTETALSIFESAPSMAIAILIIPLMDTLRVFTLRVLVGKSPFSADRFHTHHKFLLLGYSHLKTTLIMLAFNAFMVFLAVSLRELGNIKVLLIIVPSALLLTSIPGLIFRHKVRKFLVRFDLLGDLSWMLPNTFAKLMIKHFPWLKYSRSGYENSPGNMESDNGEDMDRALRDAYLKYEGKQKP